MLGRCPGVAMSVIVLLTNDIPVTAPQLGGRRSPGLDVSISSSDSHTNIIVILGTAAAPAAVMELQSAEIRLISLEPISHGISTHY